MGNLLKLIFCCFLLQISPANAQQTPSAPPKVVNLVSWVKGKATVPKQTIHLTLGRNLKEFRKIIRANTGEKFTLSIDHNPYGNLLEHWAVRLTSNKEGVADLLTTDKNEVGKHYFTEEDYVGVLYPRVKPIVFSNTEEPLYGDGRAFYFIRTVRNIRVENFIVTIRVGEIRFNRQHPDRVDSLNLTIEFSPAIE